MRTVMRLSMMCIVLAALAIVGCGGGSKKDQIVGKWEGKDKTDNVEFTKDKVKMVGMDGNYKWVDDDNIEISVEPIPGKTVSMKLKIESVSADKLVVSKDGEKKELTRAK